MRTKSWLRSKPSDGPPEVEGPACEGLLQLGRAVLLTADPLLKARITLGTAAFPSGVTWPTAWPEAPAVPARPKLVHPRAVPKRNVHTAAGRIALFHALAHIELTAINLAWDMAGRFVHVDELHDRQGEFLRDWAQVAADEARHFLLLQDHLRRLGSAYGELAAHGGLWEAAHSTRGDVAARLAIVPLVQEARALDVTPSLIASLEGAKNPEGVGLLRIIYEDEIGHVLTAVKWFRVVCTSRDLDPASAFQRLVRQYRRAPLKGPFNSAGRSRAGLTRDFYEALTL